MHGDGRDAELLAGAHDAQRDLAAVGDQDLFEHRGAVLDWRHSFDDHQRLAVFDRLAVLDEDAPSPCRARGRGDLVHRLHRFDDQQRVAGLRRPGADLDEGLGAGLGGR